MSTLIPLLLLACHDKPPGGADSTGHGDTGLPADTAGPDDTDGGDDTGSPGDSGGPSDTGPSLDTGEPHDTGDSGGGGPWSTDADGDGWSIGEGDCDDAGTVPNPSKEPGEIP